MEERNSSFELLRIISMFLIVMHHYAFHGTLDWMHYNEQIIGTLSVNVILLMLGKVGVNIFVFIGAYFLVDKKFNFRRPINLFLDTALYSFSIWLLLYFINPKLIFNNAGILKAIFPFPMPSGYWFVNSYIFILLIMSFLNLLVQKLSRKKLKIVVWMLVILWSVLPSLLQIFPYQPNVSATDFGYSEGTFFILLYFIGAYIRKYGISISPMIIGLTGVILIINILYIYIMMSSATLYTKINIFQNLYNPFSLFWSLIVFAVFTKLRFHNKFINFVSGSMFGVYLIHENSYLRPIIWKSFIDSSLLENNWMNYLEGALVDSFIIFIVCVVIDILFRRFIFERAIKFISNKLNTICFSIL
ncbi:acyltransferase family protein [Lactobacillaceae bacterium 24-114]